MESAPLEGNSLVRGAARAWLRNRCQLLFSREILDDPAPRLLATLEPVGVEFSRERVPNFPNLGGGASSSSPSAERPLRPRDIRRGILHCDPIDRGVGSILFIARCLFPSDRARERWGLPQPSDPRNPSRSSTPKGASGRGSVDASFGSDSRRHLRDGIHRTGRGRLVVLSKTSPSRPPSLRSSSFRLADRRDFMGMWVAGRGNRFAVVRRGPAKTPAPSPGGSMA